jgi:hypothetical protein
MINTNAFNIDTDLMSTIYFKSPLIPLFQRGRSLYPLFGKEGSGEIFNINKCVCIISPASI